MIYYKELKYLLLDIIINLNIYRIILKITLHLLYDVFENYIKWGKNLFT